jgi:hypothetical protein
MTDESERVIPEYNEDVEQEETKLPVKAEKKKPTKEPKKTAPAEIVISKKKAPAAEKALSKTVAVVAVASKKKAKKEENDDDDEEEGETKKHVADSLPLISSLHAMRMSVRTKDCRAGTSGNAHLATRELIACYLETAIRQAIMLVPADCQTLKAKHLDRALNMQNV